MTLTRTIFLSSSLLLVACTPRPNMEVSSNYAPNESKASLTQRMADKGKTTEAIASSGTTEKPGDSSTLTKQFSKAASRQAAAISSWEISGAMAARNKNKGWNASVNWLQRGKNHYQIRLFGPVGSGTVIISKQGNVVTYRDGPKSGSSSNADELLRTQTGIQLPVSHLYYWVRGVSAPSNIDEEKRDSTHHLLMLKQAGYTIEYIQYKMIGDVALPSIIKLHGHGVFIKFVIKHWRF